MVNSTYQDLIVKDGDVQLQSLYQGDYVNDAEVIAQDIKHRLMESGVLVEMIGERSLSVRKVISNKIIILVEKDLRIISGSTEVQLHESDVVITANTQFGNIRVAA